MNDIMKTCPLCGKPFPSASRHSRARYCSTTCSYADKLIRQREEGKTRRARQKAAKAAQKAANRLPAKVALTNVCGCGCPCKGYSCPACFAAMKRRTCESIIAILHRGGSLTSKTQFGFGTGITTTRGHQR